MGTCDDFALFSRRTEEEYEDRKKLELALAVKATTFSYTKKTFGESDVVGLWGSCC